MARWREYSLSELRNTMRPWGGISGPDGACIVSGCVEHGRVDRITNKGLHHLMYCAPHERQARRFFKPKEDK